MIRKVEDNILDILGNCRTVENIVYLPEGQLDRDTYLAVSTCLENIGGKWSRKAKGHVFSDDPTEMFENLMATGETENIKQELQFFETPEPLAKRMVELAEINKHDSILEPSAGLGAVAKFLPQRQLVCVEMDMDMSCKLLCMGYEVVAGEDFLLHCPCSLYSKIIMNPPFRNQQDITHILHAWELLADNGILVSVVSASAFFRTNKKS
ncbi:MAG: hypothetical protein KJ977_05475, partial [Candidatus Omnitrophica bacterium]|nr:hypothetical protein [Candidatus Omnitrophota bacterium]MBU2266474.1 hypothetical protein [Candidatus Omnitrophota bacterium]